MLTTRILCYIYSAIWKFLGAEGLPILSPLMSKKVCDFCGKHAVASLPLSPYGRTFKSRTSSSLLSCSAKRWLLPLPGIRLRLLASNSARLTSNLKKVASARRTPRLSIVGLTARAYRLCWGFVSLATPTRLEGTFSSLHKKTAFSPYPGINTIQ